jgi:hypothetical protein
MSEEPTPPDTGTPKPVTIVCSTVVALAVLGLYAWQTARGYDTTNTIIIVFATLGLGGYAKSGVIHREVSNVRQQTNGNTSRLLDIIERALPTAPEPPVPPAPADPVPDIAAPAGPPPPV